MDRPLLLAEIPDKQAVFKLKLMCARTKTTIAKISGDVAWREKSISMPFLILQGKRRGQELLLHSVARDSAVKDLVTFRGLLRAWLGAEKANHLTRLRQQVVLPVLGHADADMVPVTLFIVLPDLDIIGSAPLERQPAVLIKGRHLGSYQGYASGSLGFCH